MAAPAAVACARGIVACGSDLAAAQIDGPNFTCAAPLATHSPPSDLGWIVGASFAVMCVMGVAIGGNDASNSWATTVGSGALTLKHAVLIGGAFEWLGAVLLGAGVGQTIKGTSDVRDVDCWACGYCDNRMGEYMGGMFAALVAAAVFLGLATTTAMPVSTTHAIVGGVVGMTAASVGGGCLNWGYDGGLGGIVVSWVASPILAGGLTVACYVVTRALVGYDGADERDEDANRHRDGRASWSGAAGGGWLARRLGVTDRAWVNAAMGGAVITFAQTLVVSLMTLLKAPATKRWPFAAQCWASVAAAAVSVAVGAALVAVSRLDRFDRRFSAYRGFSALDGVELRSLKGGADEDRTEDVAGDVAEVEGAPTDGDDEALVSAGGGAESPGNDGSHREGGTAGREAEAEMVRGPHDAMFRALLVVVAALESFAHGANDTANSTGPLSAIWETYRGGASGAGRACSNGDTPAWVMAVAGGCVALGVVGFGGRVIKTIGSDISPSIDYHKGWCVEFSTVMTVVLATVLKYPVSTTHCKVGAVVFLGAYVSGGREVDWRLFRKIAATWALTLPLSMGLAALGITVLEPLIRR